MEHLAILHGEVLGKEVDSSVWETLQGDTSAEVVGQLRQLFGIKELPALTLSEQEQLLGQFIDDIDREIGGIDILRPGFWPA